MGMVLDVGPNPRSPACFWRHMREIRASLDTSGLNCDRENGHPFFRTNCDEEYKQLIDQMEENASALGKFKFETGRDYSFYSMLVLKSKVYYKKLLHNTSNDSKLVVKHKGLKSKSKELNEENFKQIMWMNKQKSSTQTYLHSDCFKMYAASAKKVLSTSLDLKQYYMSKFFGVAYGHPDIPIYENMKKAKQDELKRQRLDNGEPQEEEKYEEEQKREKEKLKLKANKEKKGKENERKKGKKEEEEGEEKENEKEEEEEEEEKRK